MTALKRLFGDGFRVFFLAAGLFAILSIAVGPHGWPCKRWEARPTGPPPPPRNSGTRMR